MRPFFSFTSWGILWQLSCLSDISAFGLFCSGIDMRTVRNLMWFLLAFGLTIFAGIASAQQVTPQVGYQATILGVTTRFLTVEGVCKFLVAGQNPPGVYGRATQGTSSVTCYGTRPPDIKEIGLASGNYKTTCSYAKPYFTIEAGCVATKPPVEPDPEPEPPPCPRDSPGTGTWPAGKTGGSYPTGSVIDTGGCVNFCKIEVDDVKSCQSSGGFDSCTWSYHTTGARCIPGNPGDGAPPIDPPPADSPRTDVPPFDSPKGPCPKGTVQVGVNSDGVPRCQGSGSDPKNPKPAPPTVQQQDTQQNPDGSTTTTTTTTTSNADGSTTTVVSKTTTGTDGKKTTTESRDTTKSPTGNAGKDDSKKDEEKYDLCKQNPHLTICKNSSVAGTCGQVSCDGDAIQCATLRAAAAMQCKQQENEDLLKASPLTAKGNAAINGTDLEGLPNSKNAEIVNIPTLGAQGWLGNGAAFRDVSITVQGKQIVVPLSKWSDYLLPFRYIMMIIASLISYRILAGAITRS